MLKSVLVTNSFMFVVALISYPGLFVFNPFVGGLTVISLFQTTSLIGLAMSLAMPLWVHRDSSRTGIHLTFFLISCLLWPVSILAIRMVLFASFGDFGFSYLINFPIFCFHGLHTPGYGRVTSSRGKHQAEDSITSGTTQTSNTNSVRRWVRKLENLR